MVKTICDTCANRKGCNWMDRQRGQACKDYKEEGAADAIRRQS